MWSLIHLKGLIVGKCFCGQCWMNGEYMLWNHQLYCSELSWVENRLKGGGDANFTNASSFLLFQQVGHRRGHRFLRSSSGTVSPVTSISHTKEESFFFGRGEEGEKEICAGKLFAVMGERQKEFLSLPVLKEIDKVAVANWISFSCDIWLRLERVGWDRSSTKDIAESLNRFVAIFFLGLGACESCHRFGTWKGSNFQVSYDAGSSQLPIVWLVYFFEEG